jgi:hypothetical protein
MAELREFQLAAVRRIVDRLNDGNGSRRFLLADEVGLGKTLVAKGVIEELRRLGSGRGFTIVYICSNSEIADQNRDKLCDETDSAVPGRLSLLALQSKQIAQGRKNGLLQVFAFTPGTSLQVERGTGIVRERRLLLYLLFRVWGKRVNRMRWREFMRCSAGEKRWMPDTRFQILKREFFRTIAGDLQILLKAQWQSQQVRLVNLDTGAEEAHTRCLQDCIDDCVENFASDKYKREYSNKNRNRIIGELRKGLAQVSLEFLDPQLTILDEFQRFSDILVESRNEKSIVGKLFNKGSGAILILSATPYKMYTQAHESEDHHQDFLKTLAFLRNEPIDGPSLSAVQHDLRAFRERLALGEWAKADDPELAALKGRIEDRLKEVMCRTERNWHLEDAAKGIAEENTEGESPQQAELVECIQLRQFLLKHKVGDWNITEFWKSSPSVLSFMDGQYGLTKRLRRDHLPLPPAVLRPNAKLPDLAKDNAKFRLLFEKVFGRGKSENAAGNWKYLWVRPTYTYYKDSFYLGFEPTKYLVFSHWRFVPKAISVLTSQAALKHIGRARQRLQSTPLQFRKRLAFYPFDVCYPSPVLADSIEQLRHRCGDQDLPTGKQLFRAARQEIKALLARSGVQLGETRTAPLWKIMARMEAHSEFGRAIRTGMASAIHGNSKNESEHFPKHVSQYIAWLDDSSPLSISPMWVDRLTRIALYSPAVSLLRSVSSLFCTAEDQVWQPVLEFCMGSLRSYFNKKLVQTIIRRQGSGSSYTEKILSYCGQAHLQAVLDEYSYLVRHVLQQDDAKELLDHIGRAMGMWSGSPRLNERTQLGHISRRPQHQQAHFALAFGDDVSNESAKHDGKARKSVVREAFNSPFWPFVLATTSVGQEGLDFHLYCRDVVHWNLPSNPVDLEQREGRINRYDGLSIRRNIGGDFRLGMVSPQDGDNLWQSIFQFVTEKSHGSGKFNHGLFPHWIYQSSGAANAEVAGRPILRRHLLFYAGSRDREHYVSLKKSLSLYRLVFGQPRQQDMLEQILAQHLIEDVGDLGSLLSKYMINLSALA